MRIDLDLYAARLDRVARAAAVKRILPSEVERERLKVARRALEIGLAMLEQEPGLDAEAFRR